MPSVPFSLIPLLYRKRKTNKQWNISRLSKASFFYSRAKCEAIDMKMMFYSRANKAHFLKKGFALSLVLKTGIFEIGNGSFEVALDWVRLAPHCTVGLFRRKNVAPVPAQLYSS